MIMFKFFGADKKKEETPTITGQQIVGDRNRKYYHGSYAIIENPDLERSREDIDFGKGFYLTEDFAMAAKWACRKTKSIVNEYTLDLTDLKVYAFSLDKEWLDFVVANRNLEETDPKFNRYDILIGAIADDKMYSLIELYEDGLISPDVAIKVLNCMDYGNQIVLKTEKARDAIILTSYKELVKQERDVYRERYKSDKIESDRRTRELLKRYNTR